MFMKGHYFITILIIPSPRDSGNDIDVYMAPLINELIKEFEGNRVLRHMIHQRMRILKCILLYFGG